MSNKNTFHYAHRFLLILILEVLTLKSINYKNPKVASYLLLGSVFFIIGFSKGFVFFFLGVILILGGLRENSKLS